MLLSVQASPLLSDAPSARASPLQAQEAAQEQRLACAAVPEEHCEGKARWGETGVAQHSGLPAHKCGPVRRLRENLQPVGMLGGSLLA